MKKTLLFAIASLFYVSVFAQGPTVYITNGGNNYSVIEGNSYNFTVSLYSASPSDVVIEVATISQTADATDFTPLNITLTIPAGQISSDPLSIPTTNDSSIEGNENFSVQVNVTSNNTSNTTVTRSIYVYDNDATPSVIVYTTPSLVEGNGYSANVSLSNYFNADVTIEFTTSEGTAEFSDFNATNTSLTIVAGQNSAQFSISTLDDIYTEEDETYTITANVTSGNTSNTSIEISVTILDNDTTPTLALYAYQITEGYNASVSANLNRTYNSNVVVQLTTANGTANSNDYTAISQTKTITVGNQSVNFNIPITNDVLDEPVETINLIATVTSGNTTNLSQTGTLNIIDNDGLPDLSLDPVYPNNTGGSPDSLSAEEGYPLKFRPRLTHPSPVDTDIVITTTNGSADASDFTTSMLTTTIPAGQYVNYEEELSYPTILDQLEEDDENLFISALVTSNSTYNDMYTLEAFILDNYEINAQADEITSILNVGTTFQVLDNDTFEGLPVDASNLNVSLIGTNTIGVTLSNTGLLTVPATVPQGYHQVEYQICESANPNSCDSAGLNIIVESPLEASYTVAYVDFNGDGFTSVGDTFTYEFTILNNGNAAITAIDAEIFFPDLDITGGPLANLNAGETDATTFSATHIITQDDINFGYSDGGLEGVSFYGTYYGNEVRAYLYNPNLNTELSQSDGLKLNAFVDANANGTQEMGEINFPLGQFNYETNADGIEHNLYVTPHYLYESNPNTTYNVSYTVDPDYAAFNTTSASYSNITVPTGSGITTLDFPITVTPYNDLSVAISSFETVPVPVPGFSYWNFVSFTNNSNQTVPSGTIEFTKDAALNVVNVSEVSPFWIVDSPAEITTTTTGFNYTFNALQPYQTRSIKIRLSVPALPSVSLGQLVTNSVAIDLLSGDLMPSNNTSSLTQTIVGSYDPNDVTERHGGDILFSEFTGDDYLTYTIRFENTGSANAINIKVEDLLDAQLDASTLKMVDASHEYTLERVANQLQWNFFGINLPPSEDEESAVGHGYIVFKVKPFPDYAVGDIIPNTAEIYFDFNPAIVTNTFTTEFVEESLSLQTPNFEHLSVFPNPVKNRITISNSQIIDKLSITSILGKKLLSKDLNSKSYDLDLTALAPGVYFLKLSVKANENTIKLIKE